MFAWLRRVQADSAQKAETLARDASNSTITFFSHIEEELGGLPRELLSDPFVIGLASMYAALVARVRSNGTAPMRVVESAMIMSIQGIFARHGCDRIQAIGALRNSKNTSECAAGHRAADLIFATSLQQKRYDTEPEVQAAKLALGQMSPVAREAFFGSIESDQVAGMLSRTLVLDRLAMRYVKQPDAL